jgi:hypothetical protein
MIKPRTLKNLGICSIYGREEKYIQSFVRKSESKNHKEDLGVNGRILLKLISKEWDGSVGWIHTSVAQDTDG